MALSFARFSDGFRRYFHRDGVLRSSFSAAAALFHSPETGEKALRIRILSAVREILAEPDGTIRSGREELFVRLVEELDDKTNTGHALEELRIAPAISPDELGETLTSLSGDSRRRLIHFLLTLALSAEVGEKSLNFLSEAARKGGCSPEDFSTMNECIEQEIRRREQIFRSGAGIIVALIVLFVFVLTATLLRSVVFGLLAAYLLLPMEKYFERKLRKRSGLPFWISSFGRMLAYPLVHLSRTIMRKDASAVPPTPDEEKQREEKSLISRSVTLTAFAFLLVLVLLGAGLSSLTGKYVSRIGDSLRQWHSTPEPELAQSPRPNGVEEPEVAVGSRHLLERFKDYFHSSPLLRQWAGSLERMLHDEKNQQELLSIIARRTGGIFSFTFGVLGTIGAFLFDLLLTVFFALLFLLKLAEFCREDDINGKRSEYIVRTVFNGNWLPGADEGAIAEARRIVGGVFNRLRIWARGYITLMLIDGTVYTILLGFLRVPYFPLLGMLAGCGILLPYIGPITACSVTLLVTLIAGDGSLFQLMGVLICFLLYSGVIEQFILYPLVIGESLGLSTLETIIVVLLGAIFAGISGMILALPAASVLKYLVPQIYRCWGPAHKEGVRPQ